MSARRRMKAQRRNTLREENDALPRTTTSKRSRVFRSAAALIMALVELWIANTLFKYLPVSQFVVLFLFQNVRSARMAPQTEYVWRGRRKRQETPLLYGYEVVNRFPHDSSAFTQGFQFEQICSTENGEHCMDVFLESTGLYGESTVRRSLIESGEIVNVTNLHRRFFGEGLTRFGDRIYQLTWRTPSVLVYSKNLSKASAWSGTAGLDGWGLTADEDHLIMTDSGSALYWIDPETFELRRQQTVTDGGREIRELNELEYIDGMVWANVWYKDCIAMIEPENGQVHGWVLLRELRMAAHKESAAQSHKIDVLNGIAYDADRNRLFVTGKLWPSIFEIKITPGRSPSQSELENIRRRCIP